MPLLETYKELFAYINDSDIAEVQKYILLKVLKKGQEEMRNAIAHFDNSIFKLTKLKLILENESRRGSARYQVVIGDLRIKGYTDALKAAVVGASIIIYFIIFYRLRQRVPFYIHIIMAAAFIYMTCVIFDYKLVEDVLISFNENALVRTQTLFDNLVSATQHAQTDVGKIKERFQEKIREQRDLSAQIEMTETITNEWATLSVPMFKSLKENLQRLIKMCQRYIRNPGDEENHMYRHAFQEENSENVWSLFQNRTDL